jgi:hydrogenase maturation factor
VKGLAEVLTVNQGDFILIHAGYSVGELFS